MCGEYECFLKTDLHDPKWLHNYLKVDPKWFKVTFIHTKKIIQSDPKLIRKWPQSDPKAIPKSTQNDLKPPSYVEFASKDFPKWI